MRQLKQNKKYNYRIYENFKTNAITGDVMYYTLTDYDGNFIDTFPEYHLLENYLKNNLLK